MQPCKRFLSSGRIFRSDMPRRHRGIGVIDSGVARPDAGSTFPAVAAALSALGMKSMTYRPNFKSPGAPLAHKLARDRGAGPFRRGTDAAKGLRADGKTRVCAPGACPQAVRLRRSRKCLRNFWTLGATTARQYGWEGLRAKYSW